MPPEMWLPLLVMALGFYCFAAHNVLSRMRLEVLRREGKTRWVNNLFAVPAHAVNGRGKPNAMYFSSFSELYIWTGMAAMSGLRP
ncbi:MAG: hypothetical protein CM15mP120_25540 [Pseudomonadota bacterium]|nr:MAG: hypothetical protein CM15mP120_25540 [Pseudomonadota bacterium]